MSSECIQNIYEYILRIQIVKITVPWPKSNVPQLCARILCNNDRVFAQLDSPWYSTVSLDTEQSGRMEYISRPLRHPEPPTWRHKTLSDYPFCSFFYFAGSVLMNALHTDMLKLLMCRWLFILHSHDKKKKPNLKLCNSYCITCQPRLSWEYFRQLETCTEHRCE